jgi:hypothetical protein
MEVPLGHVVPPVGLGDRVATHEYEERRVGVVPKSEPYFPLPPPIWKSRYQEVEVEINFTKKSTLPKATTSAPDRALL